MILDAVSSLYGAAARWRRRWYAREPSRRRRLDRPVVSVGNLRAGGSGKTPVVEHLARLLVSSGERPAILSRGYARRVVPDGVTVVSDGEQILAAVDIAGDEPLMLARRVPGVPVLVCGDRFLAGRLAERRLGATVHLLDDGFQHFMLERDVDLLLVGRGDLDDELLPAGRLREPLETAAVADALLVAEGELEQEGAALCETLGVATAFGVRRTLGEPRWLTPGPDATVPRETPVFAVAAVARPERFFTDLQTAGWRVAGTLAFRDHHRFGDADLERIGSAAIADGAAAILTTEKDAARLGVLDVTSLPLAAVPMRATVEPSDTFREWLLDRIGTALVRSGGPAG